MRPLTNLLALLATAAAIVVAVGLLSIPRLYSATAQQGEDRLVIRAPQGGILRAILARDGMHVRADTIVAEIVVTEQQPPSESLARSILYKRVENARYESQRGGLKGLLLKPDLRAREVLDKEFGRFVAEQRQAFARFQTQLQHGTEELLKEKHRLAFQIENMEREIGNLKERRLVLRESVARGEVEKSVLKDNARSIRRHAEQLAGLKGKSIANTQRFFEANLQIREQSAPDLERTRFALNMLYQQMGLPSNAFDRIGLSQGVAPSLRRLIARRAGVVVVVRQELRPGDVVREGEALLEILPAAESRVYSFRSFLPRGVDSQFALRHEASLLCQGFGGTPYDVTAQVGRGLRRGGEELRFSLFGEGLRAAGSAAPQSGEHCTLIVKRRQGGAAAFREEVASLAGDSLRLREVRMASLAGGLNSWREFWSQADWQANWESFWGFLSLKSFKELFSAFDFRESN